MTTLKDEIGLSCLSCGKVSLPPNRILDSWTCTYCHSGFLSIAMLTNLVSRETITELKAIRAETKTPRPCPHCQAKMEPSLASPGGELVELEQCRHCHLLWFEGGSLVKLLRGRNLDGTPTETPQKMLKAIRDREEAERSVREQRARENRARAEAKENHYPTCTIVLASIAAILVPVVLFFPDVLGRFAFFPAEPFHNVGVPWVSSLLLHTRSQIHSILLFVVIGALAERRLGADKFFRLFLVAGVLSKLAYLNPKDELYVTGSGPVTLSLLGFLLSRVSLKRSSSAFNWMVGGSFAIGAIVLSGNFFFVSLQTVARGAATSDGSGSWAAMLAAYVKNPEFVSHLIGFFTGLLFGLAN